MKTADVLKAIPEKNMNYLKTLKAGIKKAADRPELVKEYKATARGYIRCLEDNGIIDSFRTVWCWFTV